MQATDHYDAAYFEWYKDMGAFLGWANLPRFAPYIRETDTVLEFGCGGGYLLKNIRCARKLGIEINPIARATARDNGVEVYERTSEVGAKADVVISNHALEHVEHPLAELIALRDRLVAGGRAVFVVPCDGIGQAYVPNDINQHLYTWNAMTLGNLFTAAGFTVIHSKALLYASPPFYRQIAKFGRFAFDVASILYGNLRRSRAQVHLLAERHQ